MRTAKQAARIFYRLRIKLTLKDSANLLAALFRKAPP